MAMVRAVDFLEHLAHPHFVIEEIYRVLDADGLLYSMTPSTNGMGAFQDPFHYSFWNKNSWLYYMDDHHRGLYGIKAKFYGKVWEEVTDQNLGIVHVFTEIRAQK